ncbi:MAG: lamin tail domain-containing protein [Bacteroidota bacterium]
MRFKYSIVILLLLSSILYSQTGASLTFSEVMFRPTETNGEFVEIYNTSSSETIDLTNFKIKYYTSANDVVISFIGGTLIGPGEYAVVIENDYNYSGSVYESLIPPGVIVLKTTDGAFGSSGMANTTSRPVYLYNATNELIDTYTYSANNDEGYSDEKIFITKDNTPANWANSSAEHGTPGKENSVTPKLYNLLFESLTFLPPKPEENENIELTYTIKNVGVATAQNYTVKLYYDENGNGIAEASEEIFSADYSSLAYNNTQAGIHNFSAPSVGNHSIIGIVIFSLDEDESNNSLTTGIEVYPKSGSYNDIVINEIMYAPTSPEPEWIELYNRSAGTINLKDWEIGDNTSTVKISNSDLFLESNAYLVLSDNQIIDSLYEITSQLIVLGLPSFNNTGDDVILKSYTDRTIDSVKYNSNWGGSEGGKSLERKDVNGSSLDSANWASANLTKGGTPGLSNSVVPVQFDLNLSFIEALPAEPIVGDTIEIFATVENIGTNDIGNYTVSFYEDVDGDSLADVEELFSEINNVGLAAGSSIIILSDIIAAESRAYNFIVVVTSPEDINPSNNQSSLSIDVAEIPADKYDLVINEIMYAPGGDEPEWVEIYNRSDRELNLNGWRIGDNSSTVAISTGDYNLSPQDYLVITKDSSIVNYYSHGIVLLEKSLPVFSNTGDDVILRDNSNRTIDSLKYSSSWGGNSGGRSLERIDVDASSTQSTNWGTSIGNSRATPSLENSITQKDYDVAIVSLTSPQNPAEVGKPIIINVEVKNNGKLNAENISVELYNDSNSNSIPEPDELIDNIVIFELTPGDVGSLQFTSFQIVLGENRIIAAAAILNDQFLDNNTSYLSVAGVVFSEQRGDLVINEIMYAPNSPEPEWVEIYNNTDNTIDLKGYQIADNTTKTKIFNDSFLLLSNDYLVIAKDSSILLKHTDIQNLHVSEFATLNNTSDDVVLYDSLDRVIDSVFYKSIWGGSGGKSLERKNTNVSSADSTSWLSSIATIGSTPGLSNSVLPLRYDLKIEAVDYTPTTPYKNDSVKVNFVVQNIGSENPGEFVVKTYHDVDENGIAEASELIQENNFSDLAPDDTVNLQVIIYASESETYRIISIVESSQDQNNDNNSAEISFTVNEIPADYNEVIINEIMYAPNGDEPEWIEIYNKSGKVINLKNWKVGDKSAVVTISSSDYLFEADRFLVISKDSTIVNYYRSNFDFVIKSLPTFSNTGDDVIIRDGTNKTIDSVKYSSSWGGNTGGKSLERKDHNGESNNPSNWGTSINSGRATPGLKNSLVPKSYDLAVKSFSYDGIFVMVGDTLLFNAEVHNTGISPAQTARIKFFYDSNNNNIPDDNELLSWKSVTALMPGLTATEQFNFDQLVQGNNRFILEVEFNLDEDLSNNLSSLNVYATQINEMPGDIVINEIMYAPISPEPEWIEIVNRSQKIINLKGYRVKDDASSVKVFSEDKVLSPNEYFVIARDSNFFGVHPGVSNVIISSFPSLSNSADKIILADSLNRTIDSVYYESSWGGYGGKSLERRDPLFPSGYLEGWWTSLEIGGTPGKLNSIAIKDYDVAIINIRVNPREPVVGESVKINSAISNKGRYSAVFNVLLYEIINNRKIFVKGNTFNLGPADDVIVYFTEMEFLINNLTATRTFEYEIEYPEDQDTTNNRTRINIRPGYIPGTVKINEIMFNPVNGESEWFELYNDSDYTVDLEKWTASDILTTPQQTELGRSVLMPHSLLVAAKDSSIVNFHNIIPSVILISSFANLNNDEDGIVIKDPNGTTIDSVRYQLNWGGANGKSIERINIIDPSTEMTNWGSSQDVELSTPGRTNSLTPKEYDVAIDDIYISPINPMSGEYVTISARLFNYGSSNAVNLSVQFFIVSGTDTSLFETASNLSIASGDSLEVNSGSTTQIVDQLNVLCRVIFNEDEELSNNVLSKVFGVGHQRNSLLITEIMYNPLDNESEWIEFVNNSQSDINLKDWTVSDQFPSINKVMMTADDYILQPNEYAVITPDTNKYLYDTPNKLLQVKFGSLSNTSDGIILFDNRGNVIDSLVYYSKWGGGKGVSLERLLLTSSSSDSTNWSSSLSQFGATPGLNSSYSNVVGYQPGSLIINEIMFDPETGNSEFVEFYNNCNDTLQIGGMTLQFGSDKKIYLSSTHYKLAPYGYLVLAHDSTVYNNYNWLNGEGSFVLLNSSLSLSNESSLLLIKDTKSNTLDSLVYFSDWHNRNIVLTKNKSLERINPSLSGIESSNWNTSVDLSGASPGKENSIFIDKPVGESKVTISPNPFSPDNDGFEDFTIISFSISQKLSQVRIKVFDSLGRLVRTLANDRASASNNSIVFDGLDDSGRALRIGIYILLIEISTETGYTETIKTPVVVARKL